MRRPAVLFSLAALTGAAGLAEFSSSGRLRHQHRGHHCGRRPGGPPPERSPPGDMPDDQQFVDFTYPGGAFSVKVPEGWSSHRAGRNRHLHRQLQHDL